MSEVMEKDTLAGEQTQTAEAQQAAEVQQAPGRVSPREKWKALPRKKRQTNPHPVSRLFRLPAESYFWQRFWQPSFGFAAAKK